ncbi:hypothetical protein ACK8P5_26625 (plasmid) [Paenibacillus sp. EC2-1]|uniref:hypothetical protein n=1 Tax=Paenibacillus sp. EC2-1 TaxID=3388665 RepID=UPI003BEEB1E2
MKKQEFKGQVAITREMLQVLLGLPEEVTVEGAIYDPRRGIVHVVYDSKELIPNLTAEVTAEAQEIPIFDCPMTDGIPTAWNRVYEAVRNQLIGAVKDEDDIDATGRQIEESR